ncbi:MAG: DUF2493 domain-containing protein [Bacteroidales bacterium]|nr:DUF2493 domain-containing protein [Candidatus Latescibacterota bacterium]
MRIAVVGSRNYKKRRIVEFTLSRLFAEGDELISGGAAGVDTWAADWADEHGYESTIFKAEWDLYGKAAGMLRNTDIVTSCDILIAFWDGKSKGTMDSYKKAQKQKKVTMLCVWKDDEGTSV